MTTPSAATPHIAKPGAAFLLARLVAIAEIAVMVAIFYLLAGSPPPDVNEAHYLGKARHFWDATWCAGDPFLESASAHWLFYVAFGWITLYLPLDAVAWAGRFLGWTCLALGWRSLSRAIVPGGGWCVLGVVLWHLFVQRCHMAGEWAVGGIEAKVFAIACVFFGLARVVRGEFRAAWPWLGLAAGFHVLVGGWAVVAAGLAWLQLGSDRSTVRQMALSLLFGFVLALPGIWPSLALTASALPETNRLGLSIYVFWRLPHHLLFSAFEPSQILKHAALFITWWIMCLTPATGPQRMLRRVVGGALAITACGLSLETVTAGTPEIAARIMRFYWYRLGDLLLPAGVTFEILSHLATWWRQQRWSGMAATVVAASLAGAGLTPGVWNHDKAGWPNADWQSAVSDLEAWRGVCYWIRQRTPHDAVFLTPRDQQTFKWYAERAEVVTWKDVPQDSAALVQWARTHDEIWSTGPRWYEQRWRFFLTEIPDDELRRLSRKYRFRYVLVQRLAADRELPHTRLHRVAFTDAEGLAWVYEIYTVADDGNLGK